MQCNGIMQCRDVSELLQEQIELYRVTKQNILQGLSEEAFTQMTPQARERALLQEMKSEGTLHPALYPHDKGPFTGHYKVTATAPPFSRTAVRSQCCNNITELHQSHVKCLACAVFA